MRIKTIASSAAIALATAGFASHAYAFEGDVSPYPAGAEGTYIGSMPPIPGIFALEQFNYSFANALYGNSGQKLPVPFHTSVFSATTRILFSYPLTLFGANVYSQLVLPVVSLHTNVEGNKASQSGLSNITISPVILRWSLNQNLAVAAGVDVALETGSYSSAKQTNVAVGYTSIQPVASIRYDVPDGVDLGWSNRFLINQKNSDTNYQSGTGYVADFQAGWHFGKLEIGAVGSYLDQFTDDKVNGVAVSGNGNRMRSFGMGPSIMYDAGPVSINLNYQQGLYAANTGKSNNIWLNVAIPLWVLTGK